MKELAVAAWVLAMMFSGAPLLALLLAGVGAVLLVAAYWP